MTKRGPCITSWSHKAARVYLLRDIWTRHLLVRSGDGRALISIAEAGSVQPRRKGRGISIADHIFHFPTSTFALTPVAKG